MQANLMADMAIPLGYYTPPERGAQGAGYPAAVAVSAAGAGDAAAANF